MNKTFSIECEEGWENPYEFDNCWRVVDDTVDWPYEVVLDGVCKSYAEVIAEALSKAREEGRI